MDMNRYLSVEQLVGDAVRESARTAEVVEVEPRDAEEEIVSHLWEACDETRVVREFWGTTEDADGVRREWRVQVVLGGAS